MSQDHRKHPSVDGFIRKNHAWKDVLHALRAILLNSPLTEEVKWRQPCYTFQESNVLILGAFKESCVLSFFKGALLKDPKGLLQVPGENTQAARVIRFADTREVEARTPDLKALIQEAIEAEKAGLKVPFKKITEHKLPDELQAAFDKDAAFEKAFRALTPGRQRAYLLHFSSAKQSATRAARIQKHAPRILKGKGMED
ncbi:MAG: YdeI/OmpD-associated family protein [Planctomycetota bacterium]|nr:YdeI/OmpD-associated family protein [Planctomycetota bacterium]